MKGFALYKKEGDLYIIGVAYEYADSKFVGFDRNSDVYKIHKLNSEQKEWVNSNDPSKNEKTKNYIFVGDYYLSRIVYQDFPTGKPYNQLPGGGGVYKETRKFNNVQELFKNPTVIRAIEKYSTFSESYTAIKWIIKEAIEKITSEISLNQDVPHVSFSAVAIEDELDKSKINDIFNYLVEQGKVPSNFKRSTFKDGTLDYHMTIKLGELPIGLKGDLDKEVLLNINTVGISTAAIALGVSGDYFSDNEFQHITLAFEDYPQDSKYIRNWIPLPKPFTVKGTIREFSRDKKIIKRGVFDEANQIQIGNFPDQAVPAGRGSFFPKQKD